MLFSHVMMNGKISCKRVRPRVSGTLPSAAKDIPLCKVKLVLANHRL